MAEVSEKGDFVVSEDQDVHSDEATDMYHAVIMDTRQDFLTKGKDIGDMYRMGKEQQFKVSILASSSIGMSS